LPAVIIGLAHAVHTCARLGLYVQLQTSCHAVSKVPGLKAKSLE
jgi:hypothetical protein